MYNELKSVTACSYMLQRISINHDFYRRDPTRPYYEESVEDYGFVILGNLSMAYNEYNMVQWVGTMGESIYHRLLKNNQKGIQRYSGLGCADFRMRLRKVSLLWWWNFHHVKFAGEDSTVEFVTVNVPSLQRDFPTLEFRILANGKNVENVLHHNSTLQLKVITRVSSSNPS